MSTQYDSVKIRALARQISRTAGAVAEVRNDTLNGILREIPGNFSGSAATALQESVTELAADVSSISTHLAAVSKALNDLASRVEYADREAQKAIQLL